MEATARKLGVIEAFTVVLDQCPSGAVRDCTARALEIVKQRGADAIPEQAAVVLAAIAGWRSDRALRVREALESIVAAAGPRPGP